MFLALIKSMRPRHWMKNFLIFAGLIFSQNLLQLEQVLKTIFAFALFCLVSGSVYLINDVIDRDKDKAHPLKYKRALPSGRLTVSAALPAAITLGLVGTGLAFRLNSEFGLVAITYLLLNVFYSLVFKNVVLVDVILIAFGFVLRAVAGAVVLNVTMSSWFLVCTVFLALFLALSKRRHELTLLGDNSVVCRKTLVKYKSLMLDQMVAVAAGCSIIAYVLYTTSEETITKFGTQNLIFTVPFVVYGIFRYLYLVHHESAGGNPEITLFSDLPMIVNLLLYIGLIGVIIYF